MRIKTATRRWAAIDALRAAGLDVLRLEVLPLLRINHIVALLALLIGSQLYTASASAQQWKILEEESVTLAFRDSENAVSIMEISCHSEQSDVTINVSTRGIYNSDSFVLSVDTSEGTDEIKMLPVICAPDDVCDTAPGEVYAYQAKADGRDLALNLAETAKSFSFAAPGVTLDVRTDKPVFTRFAKLCRNWD